MTARAIHPQTVAVSDAGFFPDLPNLNGQHGIRALYEIVYKE